MCGIVGAIAQRDISPILLEGLRRLEYRGYDSAGVAILSPENNLQKLRCLGKVSGLNELAINTPLLGGLGIAHTRWATHGEPSELNAHPHTSNETLAVVHNGIIENHHPLREELKALGYTFQSETDTEVIAHLIHHQLTKETSLLQAVQKTLARLKGAYSIAVIDKNYADQIIVAREGSPLVIGLGIGENFIASDQLALLPVTRRYIYLEEGDVAKVTRDSYEIYDVTGKPVDRSSFESDADNEATDKGQFRHFMLKEIFEQPKAVADSLEGRIVDNKLMSETFGPKALEIFPHVERVQIVACGTSFNAGMVAKYWLEELAQIPCQVEVSSEIRYRKSFVDKNTLFLTISQSGETADTLAALRNSKKLGYLASLTVCNVAASSLVRESDLRLMTRAGVEIGVASTKAFTTQLACLMLVVVALGRYKGMSEARAEQLMIKLQQLPREIQQMLLLDSQIALLAEDFSDKQHALFLGRGSQYPIAVEGALKLKEISYIHAEAYPSGELKHGPLALVDPDMPIITILPNDELLDKSSSNLEEVKARGGQLYVFADETINYPTSKNVKVISLPKADPIFAPIVYIIAHQLLSYHVAVLKGTDVDQPRNLAKSVTVE